jgi:hypothetical protein
MSIKRCQFCGMDYRPESGARFCCDAGRDHDVKGPAEHRCRYRRVNRHPSYRNAGRRKHND